MVVSGKRQGALQVFAVYVFGQLVGWRKRMDESQQIEELKEENKRLRARLKNLRTRLDAYEKRASKEYKFQQDK
jgi:cell division protein FtsB